jgi:hypothetical protein
MALQRMSPLSHTSGLIREVAALIVSHDKRGSTLGDAISENHDGSCQPVPCSIRSTRAGQPLPPPCSGRFVRTP